MRAFFWARYKDSKLYLSGIEILAINIIGRYNLTLNCTLVELKFKRVLRIVRQSFSKLYLSGIEIKDLLKKYHTLAALNCTLVELKFRQGVHNVL